MHVCVSPVRRFITECVCVSQLSSCVPLSSHARLLKNVDYSACASVSWPCMCVSARFEGLLQRVCVSQQSSCSSSHGPPFSPLASPHLQPLLRENPRKVLRPRRPAKHTLRVIMTRLVAEHGAFAGGVGARRVAGVVAPRQQVAFQGGLEGGGGVALLQLKAIFGDVLL